jgi:S1-C subfamily serine protease
VRTVDLAFGLLILFAAFAGVRLGMLRALPLAGAAAGVVLASRVPLLIGQDLDSDYALNIAIVAALALGGIGAVLGEAVARRASKTVRRRASTVRRPSMILHAGVGAILVAAAAAVAVWAVAPVLAEVRATQDVRRSDVVARLDSVLAPVRPPRDKSARPVVAGSDSGDDSPARRRRPPASGEPGLRNRPEVIRAERNLVKVMVNRCGGGFNGTGWIAGPNVVVTNAHVVTAATKVTVSEQGQGRPLSGYVVWFDGIHDLALIRVNALNKAIGIPLAANVTPGKSAISLGFPNGKYTLRRATVGPTTTRITLPREKLPLTAGISLTMRNRLVTVLRGISAPGGSGSPVVDRRGQVVGTIFAGIPQSEITLAVPSSVVRYALKTAQHPVKLPSCTAPPITPTLAQSRAARGE